jgi:hypothetical protein
MCPMQNLKAVTMGMATARALFGSNKPNPAIAPGGNIHAAPCVRCAGAALWCVVAIRGGTTCATVVPP